MESRPQLVEGVQRLKGIFLEVPGTRLTVADAASLSGLDQSVCEVVLDALEDAHFLKRLHDGRYQRRTSGLQDS
jgi:predicted transcriptional regulator of viral defense system